MGDFENENNYETLIPINKRTAQLITVIMLIIGLFAPFSFEIYNYGWISDVVISSMFWMFRQSSYVNGYYGFSFVNLSSFSMMFPFLLLRMVPVFQISRYYDGKTTKKHVLIATLIGDGLYLIFGILALFFSMGGSSTLMIPLPFEIIFGFLVLWKHPILEPNTPWEGISDSISMEDKKANHKHEKQSDDEELW